MKDKSKKDNADIIKSFKELEEEEFKDIKLDDFKKSQLNEFREKELADFKKFLKNSKMDINIEKMRSMLNSDDDIKKIIKELDEIGLDGRASLKLLDMLKK